MPDPGSRRGRTHDAEGAREAILDAAEEVFAEHGFDGARIDAIAEKADYNKSLIFQYYEDKLGLYSAVIRRADEQTRQTQEQALLTLMRMGTDWNLAELKNLLREYIGWYYDYLLEHPRIMRIFNWEMAEGWQTYSKILSERDYQDVEDFAPIFAKLAKAGVLRANPAPLLQFATALFLCHIYFAVVPFYSLVSPEIDSSSPAALAQAREFVIEFIVNGLLIMPSEARP